MEYIKIFIVSLIATTAMTVFSYVVSAWRNRLYKEPVLLVHVLHRLRLKCAAYVLHLLGWMIHYAIGLVFVVIFYTVVWHQGFAQKFIWSAGFLAGCIFGLVGIGGWHLMFAWSKNPPVEKTGYYCHLFLAHIVFGLAISWAHGILMGAASTN